MAKASDGFRYCFRQDDSGHWYLVPTDQLREFERIMPLIEDGTERAGDRRKWNAQFAPMMLGTSMRIISFEDPKEDPECGA